MSSDSDDDDGEVEARLREAVATDFICDSMYKGQRVSGRPEVKAPESLRYRSDGDDQFNDALKVTPQFRNHVARLLTRLLDESLEKRLCDAVGPSPDGRKRVKSRVRLFTNSETFVRVSEKCAAVRRAWRKEEMSGDVKARMIREAAVTPERILSQADVKHWAKRSRHKPFRYRKHTDGKLHCVELPFV